MVPRRRGPADAEVGSSLRPVVQTEHSDHDPVELGGDLHRADPPAIRAFRKRPALERHPERLLECFHRTAKSHEPRAGRHPLHFQLPRLGELPDPATSSE